VGDVITWRCRKLGRRAGEQRLGESRLYSRHQLLGMRIHGNRIKRVATRRRSRVDDGIYRGSNMALKTISRGEVR
jgi:hypothetical protein